MPRVENYMQRDFIRVPDTTQISQALKMIFESGENYVVVVRGGVQIAGIVTRTDIISLRSTIVLDLPPPTRPLRVRVEPVVQRQPVASSRGCCADGAHCTPTANLRSPVGLPARC